MEAGEAGSEAPFPLGHMTTAHVRAPAKAAFAYLADPIRLGRWSLGCFDTAYDAAAGLHAGTSLYDGSRGWFSIEADAARGIVDYRVGRPGDLAWRISARIVEAHGLGYPLGTCLVMLSAWRPADMPADRWRRLCAAHEAEIGLVKSQIEAEARGSGPRSR